MKKAIPSILLTLLFSYSAEAQQDFPSVMLKTSSGRSIDFADLVAQSVDSMIVMSFWATWCIPCITELDNINEVYKEKQQSKAFKFIGVSIDDTRTSKRVKPFIQGKGWTFDVLLDINSELKRAMNVTDVPHVLIIKNRQIVYRHTGYIAGEEENLFEEISKL